MVKNSDTTIEAPAKINLGLKVAFRYPNGYHHLVSVFTMLSLSDTISVEFIDKPSFNFQWENDLPKNSKSLGIFFDQCALEKEVLKKNLVYKVWFWFNQKFPKAKVGVNFHIIKRIPSPSGLGGGSSDAAALLYLLSKFAKIDLFCHLEEIEKIGADIPYCLWWQKYRSSALISGIGIPKCPVNLPKMRGILGIPDFNIETKEIFSILKKTLHVDKKNHLVLRQIEDSILNFSHDTGIVWLHNELWSVYDQKYKAILEPAIGACSNKLALNAEQVFVSLSGSGPAFFALVVNDVSLKNTVSELCLELPQFTWLEVIT